jgi:hypothetical protein
VKSWHQRFPEKSAASSKKWRINNPEKYRRQVRNHAFKKKYGITLDERDAIIASQGGKCALCPDDPGPRGLFIDHNHKTKKVRGALCHRCNTGIGMFRDNPELLAKAIEYITTRG